MVRESDKLVFDNLISECAMNGKNDFGIGTYSEKSIHFILKSFFERDTDYHEVAFKGYVADAMRDGRITEIQTATLSGLRDKLDAFLPDACVRLVFPIRKKRKVIWIDPQTGEVSKSPRYTAGENMYSLLCELIYIVDYLRHPSLTLTVVEMNVEDYRYLDGYGADRKKRASKIDTVPVELVDIRDIDISRDLADLVPKGLPEAFTRNEFSSATKLKGRALWAALKVLETLEIIKRTDPIGRRHRYKLT